MSICASDRRRLAPPLCVAAAVVALAGGCKHKAEGSVASLAEITSGSVDKRPDAGQWAGAGVGDRFGNGDTVRTSADGGARIAFTAGGGLRMGPRTTIRFGRSDVDQVEGEVEALDRDFVLGDVTVERGSKIRVTRSDDGGLAIEVTFGQVLVTRDGQTETIGENQIFVIGVDFLRPVIERPADAGVPDAGPADAAPTDAGPAPGQVTGVIRGRGARSREQPDGEWSRLPNGEHALAGGTSLRLRSGSSATLRRGDEETLVSGPAEITVGGDGAPLLAIDRGKVSARATGVNTSVRLPGGSLTALASPGAGSRADAEVGRHRSKIVARSGSTNVVGEKGGREKLQIGESIKLSRSGAMEIFGRAPLFSHFSLPTGLSASVHDPGAPTNVGFAFDERCSGAGIVELSTSRSFRQAARISQGVGTAVFRLSPGTYRYRVRCITEGNIEPKPVATGYLRLNRSAGTKRLPPRAATNTVDADGRKWNILYQNLLPNLRFRWPAAPESGDYTLHVQPARGPVKTYPTNSRSHLVKAGTLGEGTHTYWFTTADGKQSKKTQLRISFDNAAASGYVKLPRVRQQWSAGPITVEGATIKGGAVSVGGTLLQLDDQHRFSTQVPVAADQPAVAIRFSHPKSGIHYYLRRNAGR